MQKWALAAREAHLALLDLKKVVDEAARTTHAVELEAVHLAISPGPTRDSTTALRVVMEKSEINCFRDSVGACSGEPAIGDVLVGTRAKLFRKHFSLRSTYLRQLAARLVGMCVSLSRTRGWR